MRIHEKDMFGLPCFIATLGFIFATNCAYADSWIDPDTGYTWTYRIIGEEAEIYCAGWSCAVSPSPTGVVSIPSELGGKSVTSIGGWAFYNCAELMKAIIPNGVTNIGQYVFQDCVALTNVTIPDSVTSIGYAAFGGCSKLEGVVIPTGVTNIEDYTFYGCSSMSDISIPASVTGIGDYAFYGCRGLTSLSINVTNIMSHTFYDCVSMTNLSVTIPAGVTSVGNYAFEGCSVLTSVTIPDSVTSIGDYAFFNCSSLTSVMIPDGVTSIGEDAFCCCNGLADVTIPNSVTNIGPYAFSCCVGLTSVTIPDSVTSIVEGVFYNCSSLGRVTICDGVISIEKEAFCGCSGLTSVVIPSSVTSVAGNAFQHCSNVTDVVVPGWKCGIPFNSVTNIVISEGTTSIGYNAFRDCSGLTSVTIPNGVTSVGGSAFSGCRGLTSVSIPNSVTDVGSRAFNGCSLTAVHITDLAAWCGIAFSWEGELGSNPLSCAGNLYLNGVLVTDLVIPDGVTSIGEDAFSGCSSLTSVTIPGSVTSVGDRAFAGCSGLTSVAIGSCVKSIGDNAFSNCSGFTNVVIPDSVTDIRSEAFSGCRGLTNVTIGAGVTSIEYCAFAGCGLTSVTIPNSVTSIGDWAFDCVGLVSVTVPQCVCRSLMLECVFGSACQSITNVVILDGVTNIGDETFEKFSGLICVTIPNSVTNIGAYAFEYCNKLASITIPDSVVSIGGYPFYCCSGLEEVYMPERFRDDWSILYSISDDAEICYYNEFAEMLHEQLTANDGEEKRVELLATNACRVAFEWKCSCEPLRKGRMRDYLSFSVDGVQRDAICGEVDWTNREYFVEGVGEHVLCWTYQKDESGSEGEDCGWVRLASVVPYVTLSFLPGGAESGVTPEAMSFYADAGNVSLPGKGTLAWPKHTFLGWSDVETVWEEGAYYPCNAEVMALTAAWERKELAAPIIAATTEFYDETATVAISAVDGAAIYYTLDDSTPTTNSTLYAGTFTIDATTTVRAIAVMDDWFDSPEAAKTVAKDDTTFGEAVNAPALEFTTDAGSGWRRVKGESSDGYALRSGVIGHNATSRLETVVVGAGRITFSCKVAGEVVKGDVYDGLAFLIDGVSQSELMGNMGWETNAFDVVGEGSHTLSWLYVKDEGDEDVLPDDCAWIDEVVWAPSASDVTVDAGGGKTVTVPVAWLDEHATAIAAHGGDRTAYVKSMAENGRKVWECYVVGLDPENATNDFRITSFPMKADGTPDLDAITFVPPQSQWNVQGAMPVLKGKVSLSGSGEWQTVTDANKAQLRFFRVEVLLP